MLSFQPLDETATLPPLPESIAGQAERFRSPEADSAFAVCCDCFVMRHFSPFGVLFTFPVPLCAQADISGALEQIEEYALREQVALLFTDVPVNELGTVVSRYRHVRAHATDRKGFFYSVCVERESDGIRTLPSLRDDASRTTLSRLTPSDCAEYARLCRDPQILSVWGYDYREDYAQDVPDSFFLEEAARELATGSALTFAVREGKRLIGEATLYAFDGHANARVCLRILPEYRRRGHGTGALRLLFAYAFDTLDLCCLYADVRADNVPSVRLFSRLMEECARTDDVVIFKLEAENEPAE